MILRGLVADWPVVQAADRSPARFERLYLARFDVGGAMEVFFGDPADRRQVLLRDGSEGIQLRAPADEASSMRWMPSVAASSARAESIYVGSVPTGIAFPGFAAENPHAAAPPALAPRIWLGTPRTSRPLRHLRQPGLRDRGRRRFTLYAPELIGKLYVGPIDNTMAGPPVSLAASSPPDDDRFPLFRGIRGPGAGGELEPGDALYLPKLWWHQVESIAPFNGLVNYWWDAFAAGPDAPYTSMLLAMITIAERPAAERQAWKAFFDHYVFRTNGHPLAHLPRAARAARAAEGQLRPDPRARHADAAGRLDGTGRHETKRIHVRRPAQRRRFLVRRPDRRRRRGPASAHVPDGARHGLHAGRHADGYRHAGGHGA